MGAERGPTRVCGRYFLKRDTSDEALLRILDALDSRGEDVKLSGDVFPGDRAPALADGRMLSMRWGFALPGGGRPVINARGETAGEKPLFRGAGRCLLPASGYYEWGGVQKRRYAFSRPDGAVYMAGLWRRDADGERRFVILTREAVAEAARVHARMPVLFTGALRRAWLDGKNPLPELLRAAAGDVCILEAEP